MIRGLYIGTVSGFILGLSLKWLEMLSGVKVYVLLLNVDFIPYMGAYTYPEWIEFLFHVIISLLICIVYVKVLEKGIFSTWLNTWTLSFLLTLPTFFLYFPLSILAIKDVPAPTDMVAFLYWVIGHLLYAVSLPLLYRQTKKSS